jgi:hypothetical protein
MLVQSPSYDFRSVDLSSKLNVNARPAWSSNALIGIWHSISIFVHLYLAFAAVFSPIHVSSAGHIGQVSRSDLVVFATDPFDVA